MIYSIFRGENRRFTVAASPRVERAVTAVPKAPCSTRATSVDPQDLSGVFGIQGVKRNALKKVAEFYGLKYRYIYSISIVYL